MLLTLKKFYKGYQKWPPRKRLNTGLLLACAFSLIVSIGLFSTSTFNSLEWKIADIYISQKKYSQPNEDIVVIGVDENFIGQYGWPLEKNLYSDLIYYLREMGANAIAVDILFDNRHGKIPEDSSFLQVVCGTENLALIYTTVEWDNSNRQVPAILPESFSVGKGGIPGFNVSQIVKPYPQILECGPKLASHNLSKPSSDGYIRMLPTLISSGGYLFPSLSALSVALQKNISDYKWDKSKSRLTIAGKTIPVNANSEMLLNFSHEIPFYNLTDVYLSFQQYLMDEKATLGKNVFKDKLVFIGTSARLLGDNTLVPAPFLPGEGGSETPKVYLHALAAATMLSETGIKYWERPYSVLLGILLIVFCFLLFNNVSIRFVYIILALLFVTVFGLANYLYHIGHFVPIGEGLLCAFGFSILGSLVVLFEKEMDRNFLFESFKTYLSENLIEEMYSKNIRPQLGGVEGIRTAFFTDIQGFSTFSEEIGSPTRLVELLNEYLSEMTDILMKHDGTLDKYEGDAIIAFFGAPIEMPDHAEKACRAALDMQQKLFELRQKWREEGEKWPDIVKHMRMRIGINTGAIVTGNMGSKMRMNYTMMGDAVNLAARLESIAKQYGVYTLVSEDCAKRVRAEIYYRKIDRIKVVGKAIPVDVYELLAYKKNKNEKLEKLIQHFEKAYEYYFAGDFKKALENFKICIELEPEKEQEKNPSKVLMARCEFFIKDAANIPENWDGVYTAKEK